MLPELEKPVVIHCCKDRTISYRTKDEPVFNDVALPVYSVDTKEEAEALLILACVRNKERHPHPRYPHETWWAVPSPNGDAYLSLGDLSDVTLRFQDMHSILNRHRETG